jgi:hypothetical protein
MYLQTKCCLKEAKCMTVFNNEDNKCGKSKCTWCNKDTDAFVRSSLKADSTIFIFHLN